MSARVRVYIACSLDGFIAGPDDDLSWLPQEANIEAQSDSGAVGFDEFLSDVGALLMGRRTYDVVTRLTETLPYGERPILVATNREIEEPLPWVQEVQGSISEMIEEALKAANGKDVYLDGGNLIRQGLEAGRVDELIITMVPRLLGQGVPLFTGLAAIENL
jgi:dihydrofolate reductase